MVSVNPQRYTSEITCSGRTACSIKRDTTFFFFLRFNVHKIGYSFLGVKKFRRKSTPDSPPPLSCILLSSFYDPTHLPMFYSLHLSINALFLIIPLSHRPQWDTNPCCTESQIPVANLYYYRACCNEHRESCVYSWKCMTLNNIPKIISSLLLYSRFLT